MTLIRRLILALVLSCGLAPVFAQVPAPVPALPDTERRTSYSITASTCTCNVNFAIYGDSTDIDQWLQVWINGVPYLSSDATHGWAITVPTQTLATRARPISDAILTFNSAQTGTVQIVGARRPRRSNQFSENRGVAARDINQVITDLEAQNREAWDLRGRLFMAPAGQSGGVVTGLNVGVISGPLSSVDGDLAVWNGTSGAALRDGGQVPRGVALMTPRANQTAVATDPYNVMGPNGETISCASTQTQCLQEFLNATAAKGWPAVTYCQGTQFPGGAEPIFIQANTSVAVPVSQDWSFHSYGCNLNFSVTTIPGLIFDSQGASIFDWDGKIVYNVTAPNGNTVVNPSCVVYLNPTTNTADGFQGIYAGLIRIKSPVNNPLGGTKSTGVVCINASVGSTIQGRLDFTEINANNNAYYGVIAFGAGVSTGLMQTEININQIHGAFLHAIDIGFNGTNQANYNGNQWKVNNIENADTASRGIDTYGSSDTFDIGVINAAQGGLGIGLVAESGATWNKFRYGSITGYTTLDWSDAGTCNDFSGGNGVTGSSAGTKHVMAGGSSGCTTFRPAAAASGSVRWPAGTTDFSATGGASQVVKQVSTGAPFTVARLACSDLSNSGPDCAALLGQLPGTATNDNATAGNVGEYISCNASPTAAGAFSTATVTMTIASPGVITWTSHPLTALSPVFFTTTGALPTGITASTVYYVIGSSITANTFQIATSIPNAIAGTAIITTGTQSGTQTATNSVPLTNNAPANVCAVSLTAGDWDVRGKIAMGGAASTTVSYLVGSLSNTSVTLDQSGNRDVTVYIGSAALFPTLPTFGYPVGINRFSLSGTTTIFLVAQSGFAVSTNNGGGFIEARRVR